MTKAPFRKIGTGQAPSGGCWVVPHSGTGWAVVATPPVVGAGIGAILGLVLGGRTTGGTLVGLGFGLAASVLLMSPVMNQGSEACPP